MPQGDRTGPLGQGSMTGRALGFCNGDNTPDNVKGFGKVAFTNPLTLSTLFQEDSEFDFELLNVAL